MASYNAQLKNGPGDDIYPIVRNVRAEMPQASFDLIDDVVVYVGPTTTEYVNGHRYQCVQNGSVYSWVDITGENNTHVSGGNVNAFDGDLYTVRLSDGALTTVNFMPIRYSGDKDFNFGMKVTQATNTGAIAITCNNKAVWWSDGNLPPQFDEGNQAPAVSLPETTYMLRFHWDCDANALMGNAEYLYPAYGEMSPVEGSRGVFIKSGTTVVSSAMTINGGTIGSTYSGNRLDVYNHGLATDFLVISGGTAWVSSGGILSNSVIYDSTGYLRVSSGGVTKNNTHRFNTSIGAGGISIDDIIDGPGYIHLSGYAEHTVLSAGRLFVYSGATANHTTAFSGSISAYSSGTVLNPVVSSGGTLYILSGGVATSATVSSGGAATVYSGGILNDGVFESGNVTFFSSGATGYRPHTRGIVYVMQDATTYEGNISGGGGRQDAWGGRTISDTVHRYAFIQTSDGIASASVVESGGQIITRGTADSIMDFTVHSSGSATVSSANTAYNAIISSGGRLIISSGAAAINVTSMTGAVITSSVGATVKYLPYKRELKYIQTTGTQYINTGLNDTCDEYKYRIVNTVAFTGSQSYLGANGVLQAMYGGGKFGISTTGGALDYTIASNTIFTYEQAGEANRVSRMRVEGVESTRTWTSNFGGPLWIGRLQASGSSWSAAYMRIYRVQIFDNATSELLMDLIPVLDYADVPCMYDRVSNTCLYNAGTGTFQYEELQDTNKLIYGVEYDPSTSSPKCQRIIMNSDGTVSNVDSFDALPAHNFKRCVMDNLATRHINYYLDYYDSTKKLNGTAADLTGADGDVMVEIPITHWRVDTLANGHIRWLVSDHAFPGSELHPFFYVSPNGDIARTQYVGAYDATICDANGAQIANMQNAAATAPTGYNANYKLRSVADCKPYTNTTLANMRTNAHNNGGQVCNSLFYQYLGLMMLIEGASLNTQAAISEGFTFASAWNYAFTRLSGRTNVGNGTGESLADSTLDSAITWTNNHPRHVVSFCYRGIENPYGSVWQFEEGFQKYNKATWTYMTVNSVQYNRDASKDNGTNYAWTSTGGTTLWTKSLYPQNVATYTDNTCTTSSGYNSANSNAGATLSDGCYWWTAATSLYTSTEQQTASSPVYKKVVHTWPKEGDAKTFDPRTFLPTGIGGGTGTYMCDYFYNAVTNDSSRSLLRGGYLSHGANAGGWILNVSYGLSYSYAYFGCRLAA